MSGIPGNQPQLLIYSYLISSDITWRHINADVKPEIDFTQGIFEL